MTITIVADVGSASANSFVTVDEADAYLATRLNSSAWTGTEPKKQALCEATRDISAIVYQGWRVNDAQALSWPRFQAPNPDASGSLGYATYATYYLETMIPQRIKDATCELALEFLRAGTSDIVGADSTVGVIERTVGPLTTRWQPGQRVTGLARYPRIMKLIGPLLSIGSGQVRLVR